MKKFTTFLSVLALMLVSVCANAQLANGTDYIIQNVESGKYLGGGNSWGTQASLLDHPQVFTATLANGAYKLDSHQSNGGNNHFLSDNGFVDGGGSAITLDPVEGGAYTLKVGAKFAGVDGTVVTMLDANPNATWKVISVAEALAAAKKSAYQGTPADVTFLVKDPNFSRNDQNSGAWARRSYADNAGVANCNISGGNNSNNCAESWKSNNGFNIYQTVSVPNGVYTLAGQAAMNNYDNLTENLPVVYANDLTADFVNITAGETSMSAMSGSFSSGMYTITPIEGVVVSNEELKIGVKCPLTSIWALWDNFSLTLTSWRPSVGALVTDSESHLEVAPTACPAITITAPNADYIEGQVIASGWELVEGKNVIASGEGADKLVISDLPLEADKQYVLNYVFCIVQGADVVSLESGEIQIRTLNAKELAIYNYGKAVEEAKALAEYAGQHIGVGLKLYLPAKYAKYKKDLALAESLGENYVTYNDYKEGTMLIRALMMEFQPQLPVVNQRYLIRHQASGLYLNATTGESVTLAETGTPVAFHHAEGAMDDAVYYMYSTPDRKYINYTGENKWSLTNHKVSKDGGLWAINHHCVIDATSNKRTAAYYTIDGMNGALGTDAVDAASSIFGNKAQSAANSHWDIIPYTEPEISADELTPGDYIIRNRETGTYLGGANSWGTQASVLKHGQTFTVAILEDGKYTLDSHTYNNAANHYLGDNAFIDSPAFGFTIEPTGDGYFTIANGDNFVSAPAEGNVVVIEAYADAKSQWQFLSVKDLLAEVAAGQSDDLTSLIKNANFSRNSYAKAYSNGSQQVLDAAFPWTAEAANFNLMGGDNTNMCAESWRSSNGFNVYQTIEIPNGYYLLKAQAAINNYEGMTEGLPVLYGNDDATEFDVMTEGESSMAMMSASFDKGMYEVSVVVKVTTGKLTVGVKSPLTNVWAVWDNFELYTSSEAEYALQAAVKANTAEVEATEISSVSSSASPVAVFSANGAQFKSMQKGMNIVKMSDGSVKKIMVK